MEFYEFALIPMLLCCVCGVIRVFISLLFVFAVPLFLRGALVVFCHRGVTFPVTLRYTSLCMFASLQ